MYVCMYVCIGEENNSLVAKNEALQHSQEELEKSVSEITKFKEVFVLMYECMYHLSSACICILLTDSSKTCKYVKECMFMYVHIRRYLAYYMCYKRNL